MKIDFLGNGSGFTYSHNNAYFVKDNTLYLIDCSLLNLEKIMNLEPENYEKCIVILTHAHDDHASGIGLLIQTMYYKKNKKIAIYAPKTLLEDIKLILRKTGISDDIYDCIDEDELALENFTVIPTTHAIELVGKCFGYSFDLNGKKIVYSGDTCTLEPYRPFIYDNDNVEFYVDCSAYYGGVHLKYDDVKDELLDISKNANVFIMHIDDEKGILKKIEGTPISIARVRNNKRD